MSLASGTVARKEVCSLHAAIAGEASILVHRAAHRTMEDTAAPGGMVALS